MALHIEETWPYVLCITRQQESDIRQIFKKKKWNINVFIRVPRNKHDLVYSITRRNLPEGSKALGKRSCFFRGQCSSDMETEQDKLLVEGVEYQDIGIYNELLNLLENQQIKYRDKGNTRKEIPVCSKEMNKKNTSSHGDKAGEKVLKKRLKDKTTVAELESDTNEPLVGDDETCTGYQIQSFYNNSKGIGLHSKDKLIAKREELAKLWKDAQSKMNETDILIDNVYKKPETLLRVKIKEDNSDLHKSVSDNSLNDQNHIIDNMKSDQSDLEDNAEDDKPTTADEIFDMTDTSLQLTETLTEDNKYFELIKMESHSINTRSKKNCPKSKMELSDTKDSEITITKTHSNPTVKRNARTYRDKVDRNVKNKSTKHCEICGKRVSSDTYYRRHMMMVHSEEAVERREKKKQIEDKLIHVCPICQKQFAGKYGLRSHLMYMHNNKKVGYQCDLCGAVMKFKGSLVQHMKSVHTDTRLYRCDICNSKFKILQQMKNHRRRHDPDYVDTCTICGKTVKKGQLTSHLKRHSDDRPHKCSTCEKCFHEKQDLLRHMRIHSGEKPFRCPHCQYACTIKGNLTKHIKHKHECEPEMLDWQFGQHVSFKHFRKLNSRTENPSKKYHVLNKEEIVKVYSIDKNEDVREEQKDKTVLPMSAASREPQIFTNDAMHADSGDLNSVPVYTVLNRAKIIYTDCVPESEHNINQSKSHTGCHSDDTVGLTQAFNDELYTMRHVERLSYTDEQKQFSAEQVGGAIPVSQYKDGYPPYMIPHVTDLRYPYSSESSM